MSDEKLYKLEIEDGVLKSIDFFDHSCPKITIPEGVKKINETAFHIPYYFLDPTKCKTDSLLSINEISIPSSLEDIESFEAFTELQKLKSITINENNPNFKTYNGYVISGDGKLLIFVPPCSGGEEFEFKDSIVRILKYAFCGNNVIQKLVIPERIVGPYYFIDMKALEYAYLPDNVISIPKEGFKGCERLKEVFASDNLIRVEAYAFADIPVIPKLPSSIRYLGDASFMISGNDIPDKAKKLTIPSNITGLGLGVCYGREDITVYDNITPNVHGQVDVDNGMPNSNVGWIGIIPSIGYTLCASEPNSGWKPHSIAVKSLETDQIKYKVWMNRDAVPRDYFCRLASSWGDNASFDFENVDKEFKSIKGLENKSRYALYRLQYPFELSEERQKTFEKYLYKSKTDIIKMCIKIEDMDLLNEFDEFIEIGGIDSSAKEEILNTIENENVKETFLSYFN